MYDISINGNNLFVTDKIDAAIQELDLLFNTEPTELIGDVNYGTNWYNYLWSLTPMSNDLKSYITNKISQTYFASFSDSRSKASLISSTFIFFFTPTKKVNSEANLLLHIEKFHTFLTGLHLEL